MSTFSSHYWASVHFFISLLSKCPIFHLTTEHVSSFSSHYWASVHSFFSLLGKGLLYHLTNGQVSKLSSHYWVSVHFFISLLSKCPLFHLTTEQVSTEELYYIGVFHARVKCVGQIYHGQNFLVDRYSFLLSDFTESVTSLRSST